jgi:hypothetical protein
MILLPLVLPVVGFGFLFFVGLLWVNMFEVILIAFELIVSLSSNHEAKQEFE